METQNLVISFDYSWFLAKNLAYAECPIMKFHYRNSSNIHTRAWKNSHIFCLSFLCFDYCAVVAPSKTFACSLSSLIFLLIFFGLLFFPFLFLLRQLCSSSQARGKPRVKLLPARLALSLYSSKLLPISAALAFELYPMASECLRYWNYQSLIYETSSNRSYMDNMCVI